MDETKNVDEVVEWLKAKGFTEDIRKAFEDQAMDGEAIIAAFGTCAGPDCLRDILSKYGQRVKVYTTLKAALGKGLVLQDTRMSPLSPSASFTGFRDRSPLYNENSLGFDCSSSYQQGDSEGPDPLSPSSSVTTITTLSSKAELQVKKLPDPFPVPRFKEVTQQHLDNKRYDSSDRKYMVRVLSTMLLAHVQRPSMRDSAVVAKALVRKHPFLKEYDSWQQFIYIRCQNLNRKPPGTSTSENSPTPKRRKIDTEKHSYPSLPGEVEDDEDTYARNVEAIKQELSKQKPKQDVVKTLIARTFSRRRRDILDDLKPVAEICEEFPCLKKSVYVAYEMELTFAKDMQECFVTSWNKHVGITLQYALGHHTPTKDLKHCVRDVGEDLDEVTEDNELSALRCMGHFFSVKSKKKNGSGADIPFLMMEASRGTPLKEVIDSDNNHPHIVRLVDADTDIPSEYFVVIEQEVIIQCKNITTTIFTLFSVHYIFNIEYHPRVKDVLYFIQEVILGYPDKNLPYI